MSNHRSKSGLGLFNFCFSLILALLPIFTVSANPGHKADKEKRHAPHKRVTLASTSASTSATTAIPPPPPVPVLPSLHISHVAGDGGVGARDGAAAQARFADPYGLARDGAGNLYVADGGDNNRIRKVSASGVVSTLAGGAEGFVDGHADKARFHTPSGLAMDAGGNLYVADTGNNAIRKITPQGVVSTVAGDGSAGWRDGAARQARFNGPLGVAVDARGNLYVADTYNDRIRMIAPNGVVTTLAGGARPGYLDGSGSAAQFDTPTNLILNAQGELLVADTRNNAIRKIDAKGQVSTVARSEPKEHDALLRRPQGLALGPDGVLYVSETVNGRILQIGIQPKPQAGAAGMIGQVSELGIDFGKADERATRLFRPVALALDGAGSLLVADTATRQIARLARQAATITTAAILPPIHHTTVPAGSRLPWPLAPQQQAHEIVGTMGEVRADPRNHYKNGPGNDSRDHFHGGLDIRASAGTPVLAVMDGKVSGAVANWAHGELHEGFSIADLSYVHLRVGRDAKDAALDPARFQMVQDEKGKLLRVRIKRGTRFFKGEQVGSVNGMNHVHLEYRPDGLQVNPLMLGLVAMQDHSAPHIESVELATVDGKILKARKHDRVSVPANAGALAIVVEAYDRIDGRHPLGLYKLGYQVLHANGSALPGFEQARFNLEFDRLPDDDDLVKLAYAPNSGAAVFGERKTRYRYVVTNIVQGGNARPGQWQIGTLPKGEYLIRISALDYAGNLALEGRDLPIRIE